MLNARARVRKSQIELAHGLDIAQIHKTKNLCNNNNDTRQSGIKTVYCHYTITIEKAKGRSWGGLSQTYMYIHMAAPKTGTKMGCPGKWKHGPKPAVCPSDHLILSHSHIYSSLKEHHGSRLDLQVPTEQSSQEGGLATPSGGASYCWGGRDGLLKGGEDCICYMCMSRYMHCVRITFRFRLQSWQSCSKTTPENQTRCQLPSSNTFGGVLQIQSGF